MDFIGLSMLFSFLGPFLVTAIFTLLGFLFGKRYGFFKGKEVGFRDGFSAGESKGYCEGYEAARRDFK